MAIDRIVTEFVTRGESTLRNTFRAVGKDADTLEGKLGRLGWSSNMALGAGGAIIGGVGIIGTASLKAAGNVELVEKALTRSLGSASAAEAKIAELRAFAKDAPQLNFLDSSRSFQMLQTMGVETEKILPLMEAVGDATAAAGKGNEEFQRALVQIGQLTAKGKVQGEELLTLAENGIPAARILAKELGLTAEQTAEIGRQGITAEQAIEALTRGLNKEFGGAAKGGADTLLGQLAALQDATEQVLAAGGKTLIPMATEGIEKAADFIESVDEFATKHPDIVKNGLFGVGTIGLGLVGFSVAGKLAGVINNVADAKDRLTKATKLDDAAEKAKAVTALKEGGAIDGVGKAAKKTTKELGVLARTRAFLNKPLGGGLRTVGAFGKDTFALSRGGALTGAAIGAAAGYGGYDDYAAMGDDNAALKGMGTGVAAAAASMFLPGAAVPIAIATGFRYAFNELVNRPMERAAEDGLGARISQEQQKGGIAAKSDWEQGQSQLEASRRLKEQADKINPLNPLSGYSSYDAALSAKQDLETEAESRRLSALALMRQGRKQARADAERQRYAADVPMLTSKEQRAQARRNEQMLQESAAARYKNQRNGETVIRIPNRPADIAQRQRHHAAMTPLPSY